MTESEFPIEKIGAGVVGLAIFAGVFRTWLSKQTTIMSGDASQRELTDSLTAEAKKWKDAYDTLFAQHNVAIQQNSEHMELIGQLRVQNKMLRMLLIQQGMSSDELNAALELDRDSTI